MNIFMYHWCPPEFVLKNCKWAQHVTFEVLTGPLDPLHGPRLRTYVSEEELNSTILKWINHFHKRWILAWKNQRKIKERKT